jgi:hypothetical protein
MAKYIRKEPDGKGGFRYVYAGVAFSEKEHKSHVEAHELEEKARKDPSVKNIKGARNAHSRAASHMESKKEKEKHEAVSKLANYHNENTDWWHERAIEFEKRQTKKSILVLGPKRQRPL